MDLEYKMKGALASSRPQVVRVEFDPPLLGYDEVKPRLLGMKADADEALGTVREFNHSLPLPRLIIICPLTRFDDAMLPGQGSADNAFRAPLPDLDHHVPPALTDLCLMRAAGFQFQFLCHLLVVGAHAAFRDPSGLDFPSYLGIHCHRTLGRGCLCSHSCAQTSHAVAYRGKLPSLCFCASQPSTLTRVPQMAWVSAGTIFGFPVLSRLRHLIKQARIESIMKGH